MKEWTFEVKGTWAYGAPRLSKRKSLRCGMEVKLRREPDNPHDDNAVEVFRKRSKLGYVPRSIAAEIAPYLDDDWKFQAVITRSRQQRSQYGEKYPCVHVKLSMASPNRTKGPAAKVAKKNKDTHVKKRGKGLIKRSVVSTGNVKSSATPQHEKWEQGSCPHCNARVSTKITSSATKVNCPSCSMTFFVFP